VCPFCPGNEDQTPIAVDIIGTETHWQVRTVANKYPAVTGQDGQHEVIVDTWRHVLSMSELSETETADMLRMYRRRLQFYRQEKRWQFAQIFKNVGAAAGASLPHSHSQLITMPFVPPMMQDILHRSADYRNKNGECYWCSRLREEQEFRERLVEESPQFVVLCPFVSRFAGEVAIYPKLHQGGFDEIDDAAISELAPILRRTIERLEKAVFWMPDRLSYNMVLNTEPLNGAAAMHWHFSILPSLARAAGFEWGTGLHINPISPEQAAKRLRGAVG
jgi:UDPglucose--hexose-1-phosphate uridylyltransferase